MIEMINKFLCVHKWLCYDEDDFLYGLDPHSKVKYKKCTKCGKIKYK